MHPDPAAADPAADGSASHRAGPLLPGGQGGGYSRYRPWPASPLSGLTPGPRVLVVRNDEDGPGVRGYRHPLGCPRAFPEGRPAR